MSVAAQEFRDQVRVITHDLRHRSLIQTALGKYEIARDKFESRYQDWQAARQAAADTKWEAINHLDRYLAELADKLEARGTKVHWASTGAQAREIILGIVREKKAHSIIKSKAMTSEEIHLNEALQHAGLDVVESDLGEFIVQLRHEPPYHIVFPAMHLTRGEISDLFARELGSAPTDNPEELTMIARRVLRQKYIAADIGFTGANFAVAETGMISITENEGNARLTAALPKMMITLLGIEKVLPRLEDLALFLPHARDRRDRAVAHLLQHDVRRPASAGRMRRPGGIPRRAARQRPHRTAGGCRATRRAALHPLRRLPERLPDLPQHRRAHLRHHLFRPDRLRHHAAPARVAGVETSLVRLLAVRRLHGDVPGEDRSAHHLLQNRRNAAKAKPALFEGLAYRVFAFVINRPRLYRWGKKLARLAQPLHPLVKGTGFDPAYAWTQSRDLAPIARQTFKEWWRQRS